MNPRTPSRESHALLAQFFSLVLGLAILFSTLSLAVLPAEAAAKEPGRARELAGLQALVLDLEALLEELETDPALRPIFRDQGDGVTSMEIPLRPETRNRFQAALGAKNFQVLVAGHSKAAPKTTAKLITQAVSALDRRYHFWWCAVNFNDEDLLRNTIYKLLGPGNVFNFAQELTYPGASVDCFFIKADDPLEVFGIYTWRVKADKGGTAKEKFLAQ